MKVIKKTTKTKFCHTIGDVRWTRLWNFRIYFFIYLMNAKQPNTAVAKANCAF